MKILLFLFIFTSVGQSAFAGSPNYSRISNHRYMIVYSCVRAALAATPGSSKSSSDINYTMSVMDAGGFDGETLERLNSNLESHGLPAVDVSRLSWSMQALQSRAHEINVGQLTTMISQAL